MNVECNLVVPKRVYADLDETFYLDAGPDPAPDPGPSFTLLVNNKKTHNCFRFPFPFKCKHFKI